MGSGRTAQRRRGRKLLAGITFAVATFTAAGLVAAGAVSGADQPSIASDHPDYAPGATVSLSGSGWQADETVHIVVDDDQSDPWSQTSDLTATVDGAVSDSFDLPTGLAGTFTVTATAPSGSATASFTVTAPAAPPSPPQAPTVSSGESSYAPGATVQLTGANWAPGSAVHVVVDDDQSDQWTHVADLTADSAGAISDSFSLPPALTGNFTVTATADPDRSATASFRVALVGSPTLASDMSSYSPGATVQLTGANWTPGSAVHIVVDDDKSDPWSHTADVVAGLDGAIGVSLSLPPGLAATFTATASGMLGQSATASFSVAQPTISADKDDYQPGDTVVLTGAGWQSGESVHIVVDDVEGQSWTRAADVTAAADGAFTDTFDLPDLFVATYTVTATGPLSGTVTTTFRDSLSGYYEGNATGGTCADPENVLVSDDIRATCPTGQNVLVSGFGLNGIVPSTATNIMLNVEVEANRSSSTPTAAVSLSWQGGTTFTSATNTSNFNSSSDQIRTVPTSSATACQNFGRTWSWSELSDANFVVKVQTNSQTLNVDRIRVRACWNGSNVMQASVAGGSTAVASPSAALRAAVEVNHSGPDPNDNWQCTKVQIEGQAAVNVNHTNYNSSGIDREGFNVTVPSSRGTYDISFTPYQNDACTLPAAAETFTLSDAITVGIFGDSFGTAGVNTYTASSWTDGDGGGSNCAVATNSTYGDGFLDDSGYLRLRQNCTQTRSGISTAGFANVHLKYAWGNDGSPGSLVVEWKPSSSGTWNALATHTFASGGFVAPTTAADFSLGSGATNTSIDIRFIGNTANNSRNALVDNIIVTGDPQSTITFNQTGIPGTDAGATNVLSVTIDSTTTNYNAADFPVVRTVTSGTVVSFTYNTPVASSTVGKQYAKTAGPTPGSPVTVTSNTTVSATYTPQYRLTLATSPVGVGTSNVSGGSDGTFYNEGTVLSLSAATPVLFNSGNSRYVFSSWSGDATGAANPVSVTMSAPRSVTANYDTQHQLTLATNPAAVGLSNVSGGSDGTFYNEGTVLSLSAATPVLFNSGNSRYVFSSWSGDATGAANPVSVTMSAPRSVTANYDTQHQLTLATNPAAVGLSNVSGGSDGTFYNEGTVLSLSAATPVLFNSGNSRYVFSSWSGDATGAANPVSVTMSAPRSVTANYDTQHKVSFDQSGIGGDTGTNTVVTVGGDAKAAGVLPFSAFHDAGSSVTFAYESLVQTAPASGKRYRWDTTTGDAAAQSGSVLVNAAKAVTGNYVTQFRVSFDQSGIGGDTGTNTVVTVGGDAKAAGVLPFSAFHDAGSSVTFAYESLVQTAPASGKRYRWDTTTGDAAAQSGSVLVNAAKAVTGNYVTQFRVSFDQSGIGGDTGTNTVVTVGGDAKAAGVLPFSAFHDAGSSVTFAYESLVQTAPASGKRYRWDTTTGDAAAQSGSVLVNAAKAVTGNYVTQFRVSFDQSGIGGDTGTNTVVTVGGDAKAAGVLPFSAFHDAGSSVTFAYESLVQTAPASGKRYRWDTTTGDAAAQSGSVLVNAAKAVTGNYVTQFRVSFDQSGIGGDTGTNTVVTVGGDAKAAGVLPFSAFHDAGSSVTFAYESLVQTAPASGKRYRWDTTTGDAAAQSGSVLVNAAKAVTGNYVTQFRVSFDQSGIGGDTGTNTVVTVGGDAKAAGVLPFSAFHDAGSSVTFAYESLVQTAPASGKRYRWDTTTGDAAAQSGSVLVNAAKAVTGNYVTQFRVSFDQSGIGGDTGTNTVVTVGGDAKAAGVLPFSAFHDAGSSVTFAYESLVQTAPASGKRYRWDTTTGDAAAQSGSVLVNAAKAVTGNYVTQFRVSFDQSGIGGDTGTNTVVTVGGDAKAAGVLPFSAFHDAGSSVTFAYESLVQTAPASGKRYRWDTTTGDAAAQSGSVLVNAAKAVTGNYVTQFRVSFDQSGIGGDTGTNTVVTVGGDAKAAGVLPFSAFHDAGSSVTFAYESLVQTAPASGKRYRWDTTTGDAAAQSGSVLVNAAKAVTGNYVTQFRVSFDQSGIGGDTGTNTVVTVGGDAKAAGVLPFSAFHDAGSSVTFAYESLVQTAPASGKRYRWDTTTGDAAAQSGSVLVNAAKAVTGTYKVQYRVRYDQSGITLATGTNTIVTVDGVSKVKTDLPFDKWYDPGSTSTYAYSSPVFTQPASATQYTLASVTGPASPITVVAPTSVTGNYTASTFSIKYMPPLDQTTDGSVVNTGKNGRTVPVKIDLFKDGVKLNETTVGGDVTIKVIGATCGSSAAVDPVETYSDAGSSNGNTNLFRWAGDGWIYNLDTTGLGLQVGKCYRIDVYIGGTTAVRASASIYALFKPVR